MLNPVEPSSPAPATGSVWFYLGVGVVAAAVLMLQIVQTRIVSVISWYHLAFFCISMAMFGLTAGGVRVYLDGLQGPTEDLPGRLARSANAFAIATALSLAAEVTLAPTTAPNLSALLALLEFAICMAVPYYFAGVTLSLALTRSGLPVGLVYGADMIGGAAGCAGALAVLDLTDGPSAQLWIAALAALGAYLFAKASGRAPGRGEKGVLVLVLAAAALLNGQTRHGIRLLVAKDVFLSADIPTELERWNSFSRVAVHSNMLRPPVLWAASTKLPEGVLLESRKLEIDGEAATTMFRFDGKTKGISALKFDATCLAYALPGRKSAAIVGVGGGKDVLTAHLWGIPEITGIEVNPTFIDLLTRHPRFAAYAGLANLPGVELVADDARSWLARTKSHFDIIQMSLIDTWAATGAGAFSLAENGLYTLEAWSTFLDRLSANGLFTVSRWYAPHLVNETGRMVGIAVAALLGRGIAQPRGHVFLISRSGLATLIVSRAPLTAVEVETLEQLSSDSGYDVLATPSKLSVNPMLASLLASRDRATLDAVAGASQELDLSVPTDDRPFFFNMLRLGGVPRLITAFTEHRGGVIAGNLRATLSLLAVILVSTLLVLATIVVPLGGAVQRAHWRLAAGGTVYFMAIGIGFMFVEIGLLERVSVLLGHPVYSLGVVLFSIILSTGLGSLCSDRIAVRQVVWAPLTAAYLASLPFTISAFGHALESGDLPIRIGLAVGLIAPAGFLMGFGFPAGMKLVSRQGSALTPWFWGVNGAAGVLASGVAVWLSIAVGISAVIWAGALCYLLLIPAARAIESASVPVPRDPC